MTIIGIRSPRFSFGGGKGSSTPEPSPFGGGDVNPGAFGKPADQGSPTDSSSNDDGEVNPGAFGKPGAGAIPGGVGSVGDVLGGSSGGAPAESPTPTPTPTNGPYSSLQKSGGSDETGNGGGGNGFQRLPVGAQAGIIIGIVAVFFFAVALFSYFRSRRKDRLPPAFAPARGEGDVDGRGYLVPPWEQLGKHAAPGTSVIYTKMERNSINTRPRQGSFTYLGVAGDAEQQRLNPQAPPISPVTPTYARSPTPPPRYGE